MSQATGPRPASSQPQIPLPREVEEHVSAHNIISPTAVVALSVRGVIEVRELDQKNALFSVKSPPRFKGWYKHLVKQMLESLGFELPQAEVNGIIRKLDYIPRNLKEEIELRASPVNRLFGFPSKEIKGLRIPENMKTDALKAAWLQLNPAARINIYTYVNPNALSVTQYRSGVRDDVSTTTVTNPHATTYVQLTQPVYVVISFKPFPVDAAWKVPEYAAAPFPKPGVTYLEAYEALMKASVDFINARSSRGLLNSPYGGRSYHTVTAQAIYLPAKQQPQFGNLEKLAKLQEEIHRLYKYASANPGTGPRFGPRKW